MTTKQELIDLLNACHNELRNFFGTLYRKTNLVDRIISDTSFLSSDKKVSVRVYHILNDISYKIKCKACSNDALYNDFVAGYRPYCGKNCSNKEAGSNIRLGMQKKYGVDNPSQVREFQDKKMQTWLSKYGVIHPFLDKKIQDKREKTWEANYGVSHISKSPVIKKQKINTYLNKYNVDNPSNLDSVKAKKIDTCLKNHGVEHFLLSSRSRDSSKATQFRNVYNNLCSLDTFYKFCTPIFSADEFLGVKFKHKFICTNCNSIFEDFLKSGYLTRCSICYPKCGTSKIEYEVYDYIRTLTLNVVRRSRKIISPYEIDIYLPDYKLAIEFDGVYYHGENASNKRCNNNYHLYKTNLCKEKGIQLIHIFEDEWLYRKSIIKSLLKEKLNLSIEIDFCKCSVRSISVDTICEFIEKNSLCTVKNSSHNFGIFLLEELVGVFCVNYNNDLVYCNKIDYIINGLLDNIVSHVPKFSHYTVSLDRRYYPLPNLAYNWVFIKE